MVEHVLQKLSDALFPTADPVDNFTWDHDGSLNEFLRLKASDFETLPSLVRLAVC